MKTDKSGPWDRDIAELERFFKIIKLPSEPIRLYQGTMITDVLLFKDSHLSIVKAQNGNMRYEPYLNRLQELKQYIKNNLN
jgi:hypothetical protein